MRIIDLLAHDQERIRPYEFYQKMGFSLVGVMSDANGPGEPDIYVAKRV